MEWARRTLSGGNPEFRFAAAKSGHATSRTWKFHLQFYAERLQRSQIEILGAGEIADLQTDVIERGRVVRIIHSVSSFSA